MNAESTTNVSDSEKTSESKLSESDFLAEQGRQAKAAVAHTLEELKAGLGQGANPLLWAKQYPWLAVGAAAVAGFVAASALIPSEEQQALQKLASIEKALNADAPRSADGEKKTPAAEPKQSILITLLHEAFAMVRPVLLSMLSAGMASHGFGAPETPAEAAAKQVEPKS